MSRLSPTFAGHCVHYATHLLAKTLRMQVDVHSEVMTDQAAIYCFWHSTHFAPIMFVGRKIINKSAGLVSASRDGEILATWMKHLGYEIIRGSSNRKAVSSVVKLMQAARQGYSVGIALDGPKGPVYEAKPGAAFIAAKVGIPLIPLGAAYSKYYQFEKSWDKFQIPLPFAKVGISLGQPLYVSPKDDMDVVNQRLEQQVQCAQQRAHELLLDSNVSQPMRAEK